MLFCMCLIIYLILDNYITTNGQSVFMTRADENYKECYEIQNVNGTEIEWKSSINNNLLYYYSIPLCIDKGGLYVLRTCKEGQFADPQPYCNRLQMADYACMDGLTLAFTGSGDAFCYAKSEHPMTFYGEFTCPYKIVDAVDRINFYIALSNEFPLWLHYHQERRDYGYGDFISNWIHGTTFKPWLVFNKFENQCLSADKAEIKAVDCTSFKLHFVCIYRTFNLNLELEKIAVSAEAQYCKGRGYGCRISWNHKLECFCSALVGNRMSRLEGVPGYVPVSRRQSTGLDGATCENFPIYPVALEGFGIDIYLSKYELFWGNGTLVQNTFWSIDNLSICSKDKEVIMSNTGWLLAAYLPEYQLCGIELNIGSDPKLNLTFDNTVRLASLHVDNQERIFYSDDEIRGTYDIMCYQELGFHVGRYEKATCMDHGYPWFSGKWQCEAIDLNNSSHKIVSKPVQMEFSDLIYILHMIENKDLSNIYDVQSHINKSISSPLPLPIIRIVSYKDFSVDQNKIISVHAVYRIEFITNLNDDLYHKNVYNILKNSLNHSDLTEYEPALFNLKYCDQIETIHGNQKLVWPSAKVWPSGNNVSITNCFDDLGNKMKITCEANFDLGARFSKTPKCVSFESKASEELSDLENSNGPSDKILTNLTSILNEDHSFDTEDFNKAVNILEKLQSDSNINDVLGVVNTLMTLDTEALHESQDEYNVTDRVLYSLDVSLASMSIKEGEKEEGKSFDNIETFLIDNHISDYSGFAYLTTGQVVFLKKRWTIEYILNNITNLESAAFTKNSNESGILSVTMFGSPILFSDDSFDSFHRVFGVLLPPNVTDIEVVLVFPNDNSGQCAFWQYGNQTYGKWKVHNDSYSDKNFTVCIYNHTTHFGYLLFPKNPQHGPSDEILSTMTMIESSLSIFGLSVILFIATIFPEWRRRNVRFMHYCIVLLTQTILLYINSYVTMADWLCVTTGIILHFTVLVQFTWMVVIALQRYRALVLVFETNRIIFGSNWVLMFVYLPPLMLVALAAYVDWETYLIKDQVHQILCYPHGDLLLFTVIIPLTCMAAFNLFIFIWIIIELFFPMGSSNAIKKQSLRRKLDILKALVIMVFTLGITWWPGIIGLMVESVFLLYVFSIFTALQGFVIFIYLIVESKEVRGMIRRKYYSQSWYLWKN